MAEIRWSHEAERWLRKIHDYIAQDNPTAAGKVVSGIYDKAQLLSDFPELGYKYREEQKERYVFSCMGITGLLISSLIISLIFQVFFTVH